MITSLDFLKAEVLKRMDPSSQNTSQLDKPSICIRFFQTTRFLYSYKNHKRKMILVFIRFFDQNLKIQKRIVTELLLQFHICYWE